MFNYYTLISIRILFLILIITFSYSQIPVYSISNTNDIKEVGINEKLGDFINPELEFVNQQGEKIKFGQFFNGKPVVINMLYLTCPRICTFALDGSLEVINETGDLVLGTDYKFLSISFNPEENHINSAEKSKKYLSGIKKKSIDKNTGWTFLTSDSQNIQKLTQSIGYNFKKDGDEFAHPSALVVLTPEGKISRYLYGIQHNPKDFKLALIESSDGKIGKSTLANKVLLFCYQFDPIGKRYALKALNIVKAGGVVTLLALSGFLVFFWVREKGHINKRDGGSKS